MRSTSIAVVVAAVCVTTSASAADINVTNATELRNAIGMAKAGDTIILANGTYAFTAKINCSAAGPITVKAQNPLQAKIELNTLEGFAVTAPKWTFEGLDIKGTCSNDSDCEHAFHVTGAAESFVLRNSRVYDFNAQLKVNASNIGGTWVMPHKGLIEGNELFDSNGRNTSNPTTKLNIDTGDDWIVRANIIRDFHKAGGDNVSYGAFMKSGGKRGLFERNLVMCSRDTTGGTRIGLSFGGGGTAPQFCAPAFDAGTPCTVEHDGGTMRNNIIANCSDVGIYLNESKSTKILHNTLIGTTGVDFRFATTTGEAHGNVLTSKIRVRDGGMFSGTDNLMDIPTTEFAAMYLDPLKGDLRKKGDLAKLLDKATASTVTDDYCARTRTGTHDFGALEHSLGDCETTKPTIGGTTPTDPDAGVTDSGTTPDSGKSGSDSATSGDDSGTPSPAATAEDDSGCGCRTTKGSDRGAALFALAAAAVLVRRRRLS